MRVFGSQVVSLAAERPEANMGADLSVAIPNHRKPTLLSRKAGDTRQLTAFNASAVCSGTFSTASRTLCALARRSQSCGLTNG